MPSQRSPNCTIPEKRPIARRGLLALAAVAAIVAVACALWPNGSGTGDGTPADSVNPGSTAGSGDSAERPWFRDMTPDSGLDFTNTNGEEAGRYTLLESVGGGIGLLDFDGDGRLDIALPGGGGFDSQGKAIHGRPTRLFRNLGDWKFEDVTAAAQIDQPVFYTHGCAACDYDCDGWPDLLVTGYGRLALYHNESNGEGGRRFVDVTEAAGLGGKRWSTSAGWGDLDGDGYADLYVCHYADWSFDNDPICEKSGAPDGRDVCPPQRFQPLADSLYLSNGDGTFRDVTHERGLRGDGFGLGVLIGDFDDNGQPDVYVGNDATANYLYWNRDGRLEERGAEAGVAFDENGQYDGSMGVDAADYDGSGRAALWVTNFQDENHALYANLDSNLFRHESKAAGIAALGRKYVGFGTGFFDADNDGWEDLFIANGHVLRYPSGASFRQRAVLLHNASRPGRRFFENVSGRGGSYFERELLGRGVALGDIDNDGWTDLVISHSNSPVVLLRNEASETQQHHWLGVELVGRNHRDVAGSTVMLEVGGRRLTRYAKGGGSYLSSSDRRLLFGLGPSESPGRLTVRWAWGQTQHWDNLAADRYHRLQEGDGGATAPQPTEN